MYKICEIVSSVCCCLILLEIPTKFVFVFDIVLAFILILFIFFKAAA
jgi:hypothetical protein